MANAEDVTVPKEAPATEEAVAVDVEAGTGVVASIRRRWRWEDLLKRGSLMLRGFALLFSVIAFIVMASNKHGDWKSFDKYEEYRYFVAISILSTLYTGAQSLRHIHEISTGNHLFERRTSAMVDFIGDQVIAYFLVSAASAAVPLTNRMREGADNIFTDTSAASISMAFLAFFTLAFSAVLSGYKLSSQSYI